MARNPELHAAVLAAPDDDAPRLVYADWLLAQGDPRGELVAVQVELARCQDPATRATLQARERELWAAHESAWHPSAYWVVELERGFITRLIADKRQLGSELDEALDWACLRSLRVTSDPGRGSGSFDDLAPRLERMALRELELYTDSISPQSLVRLGATAALASLESLSYHEGRLTAEHLGALARAPYLSNLRKLELEWCRLEPDAVAELGWWRHPRTLRRLSLRGNRLGPGALVDIIDMPAFAALEQLDLHGTDLGYEDVFAVIAAELPLAQLDLYACALDPATARAIANAPHLASLRVLDLVHTEIAVEGLEALVASPHLGRELQLTVDGDVLGLEPDYADDQGSYVNSGWIGEPPAWLRERFRVYVGGYPEPYGFTRRRRQEVEKMLADRDLRARRS